MGGGVRTLAGVSNVVDVAEEAGARLGLITDLHFREAVAGESKNPKREGRRIRELLPRCLDQLQKADVDLVLCAGDCVDDETIGATLQRALSSREACDRLVQLALDGGGHDNVTVIVASFEFPPAASV